MKSIALLIKDRSAKTPAALRYAKALISADCAPLSVFFYGRGVYQAEEAIHKDWREIQRLCGASLILCSASAEKFGISADAEFEIAGLGELIANGLNGTRVISFG
jgi:sulfur relay (sulfurtransferase) complex TusBCD TusD component (DsrE family)